MLYGYLSRGIDGLEHGVEELAEYEPRAPEVHRAVGRQGGETARFVVHHNLWKKYIKF